MFNSQKSKNKSQWKIVIIAPLLLAFVFTFSTKTIAQHKKVKKEFTQKNVEIIELLISRESSQDDLKNITKTFAEKGLNVKFNGVKRNSKNDITTIKIDAKTNNGKATASYATEGDNGINSIHISFNNENNNLSIGSKEKRHVETFFYSNNGDKKHKKHIAGMKGKKHVFITTNKDDDDNSTTKVWVDKDGDTTKVITRKIVLEMDEDHDSDDEHEIHEITIDVDDNGKEVKTEVIKIKSKKGDGNGNFVFISGDDEKELLILVDGKEITKKEMEELNPDKIAEMNVFKGKKAIEKYGKKGGNGVIIITTKK